MSRVYIETLYFQFKEERTIMKKKIVALLMAAAMVSVVFTGCGGGNDEGGSEPAATEESGGDDAAASDLPTELETDLTGEYDPKYTLTEYTIEAAGATFVATVSANEDDTAFEIHCNFYGDEQLVEIEKDGDEYSIISDKTGFMETDSPLIIDQCLSEDNWALIQ